MAQLQTLSLASEMTVAEQEAALHEHVVDRLRHIADLIAMGNYADVIQYLALSPCADSIGTGSVGTGSVGTGGGAENIFIAFVDSKHDIGRVTQMLRNFSNQTAKAA